MADNQEIRATDLTNRPVDYLTAVSKALLGSAPIIGPFLTELVGATIPKQRMDRLVQFAQALDTRLGEIEQDVLKAKLTDQNFNELMEEAMIQAARSTSEERRAYLAAIIANGLDEATVTHIESRHLLRILGQINDIEVIWLHFFTERGMRGTQEFSKKHEASLRPVRAGMRADQATSDKKTIQDSYKEHLADLGLLKRNYKTDTKTRQPVFESSGEQKVSGYDITRLGRLLARQISDKDVADSRTSDEEEID
jgi:hypothetical protein